MTKIYLIRHAEAEGNLYRRIQGHWDGSITPLGLQQIDALAQRFRREHIDALYCSDLSRARATAEAITRYHDIPAVATPRLTEICMGVWEGRAWGDVEHDFPEQMRYFNTDPDRWSVPGCEPIRAVQKRMARAIEDLAARHDGQTIALVSHGMAIRAYLCTVLGIPNSEMATLPYGDNTSVSLLLVDGERTTVEYYNDNRHLPDALSTFGRQTWWRGSGSGAENLRYEPLRFPRDEAFYLQCYRDAWRNVHETDEGFVPELYARSAARHAQEHPGSVVRVLSGDRVVGLVELDPGATSRPAAAGSVCCICCRNIAAAAGQSSCWAMRSGFMRITTAAPCACTCRKTTPAPLRSISAAVSCRSGATPACARICCSWAGSSTGR